MLKSAFVVSFFISLSRIFGFVRDILIAQFLGVSVLSDVFFAAFRLPNFFRRVFGEGALNSSFVPIFVSLQGKNDKEKIFAQNVFSLLFWGLLVFVLLLQILMPCVLGLLFPGFLKDVLQFDLLVDLSRITIFYLLFISLVALCGAVLNSLGRFWVFSAAPIILNLTLIFSLFVLVKFVPNYAFALAWGVFLAGVLQFFWMLFFTVKSGVLLYPKKISFGEKSVKKFFKKFLPGVIGGNVMQLNLLVDSIFASLVFGAMSYLYYADRVNQLPLAMIGIAIGIALLPAMSREIEGGDVKKAVKLQNLAMEVGLAFVLPAAVALICLALPIISVLFERGRFTGQESALVAKALQIYACGLPAYVLVKVLEPGFFSRGDTKTPMKIALACFVSNVVFNSAFYFLGFGFQGIALSSVLSSYLNLSCLLLILLKRRDFAFEGDFLAKLLRILVAVAVMLLVLAVLREVLVEIAILELVILIGAGALSYFGACFGLGLIALFRDCCLLKKG